MNNVVMRKITVTGEYQPLVSSSLVASVTISTPPTNAGDVLFKGDDGSDVPWVANDMDRTQTAVRQQIGEILAEADVAT